jgi:hypothetical protein
MAWEYYFRTSRELKIVYPPGGNLKTILVSSWTTDLAEIQLYDKIRELPPISYPNEPLLTGFTGSYFSQWNTDGIPPVGFFLNIDLNPDAIYQHSLGLRLRKYVRLPNNFVVQQQVLAIASVDIPTILAITQGNLASYPAELPGQTYSEGFISYIGACTRSFSSGNHAHYWSDSVFLYRRLVVDKPCYFDLATGYKSDSRTIPQVIELTSATDKTIDIGYYRDNPYEQVKADATKPTTQLKSLDWNNFKLDLKANITKLLPVDGIVLGTLSIDPTVQISATPSGKYPIKYLKYDLIEIANLFTEWMTLYNGNAINASANSNSELKLSAAFNDYWNNKPALLDIGFDTNHSLFKVDSARTYDYHFKPQTDGSFGDLIMDSPRIVEVHAALEANKYKAEIAAIIGTGTASNPQIPAIHTLAYEIVENKTKIKQIHVALDAGKYSINDIDNTLDRVSTLGWHINRQSEILGIRVNANAEIDRKKEAAIYTRKIKNNNPVYTAQSYAKTCWGAYGRLTPHLTNSNGKDAYDIVYDIPQMVEACFEHVNRSIGIQHGTEIKIKNAITGKEDYYPNQLALALDLHSKVTEIAQNSRETYNLSHTIAQTQSEIISGIGMPITQKTLYTRYGSLFYFGHQADKGSLNTSLTTLKVNTGMLLGVQFQPTIDRQNPVQKFLFKISEHK